MINAIISANDSNLDDRLTRAAIGFAKWWRRLLVIHPHRNGHVKDNWGHKWQANSVQRQKLHGAVVTEHPKQGIFAAY